MSQALELPKPQTGLRLTAPLSGCLVPIDQVPDPVFAQKMVGDGISIDPTDQTLVAPCDGEVVQIHPSHHAVTVKTAEGIEILMHIGLETVVLKGEGFTPKVKVGDRVTVGTPLIDFDADYVALHAKSLLTQIVIANSDRVAKFAPHFGNVVAGKDSILDLTLAGGSEAITSNGASSVVNSWDIRVPNPAGLHARPSAVLVNLAKKYKSTIKLQKGDQQANAKSVVALMGLQVGHGDTVKLIAEGSDAKKAIAELQEAMQQGLGEEGAKPIAAPASVAQPEAAKPAPRPRSDDPNIVLGVAASPGVAVGYLHRVRQFDIAVEEKGGTAAEEQRKLDQAIEQAKLELESLRAKVHGEGDPKKAAIFAAHQEILEDPELHDTASSLITKGKSAAFAWKQTYTTQADTLAKLQNALLAERANDVRDVGARVLRILTGVTAEAATYPDNTVLAAEDLTPSDMATLDPHVIGFCTVAGGATSHVSILARSMDLPAIAGTEQRVMDITDGAPVILDGTKGRLRLNPTPEEMEKTRRRQIRMKERRTAELATKDQPAVTKDGHRIEVVANIGSLEDAQKGLAMGSEGVGLLRTEFVFMERSAAPTEDEQTEIYGDIAAVLEGRPMIIRTLDVGGDKPLPYMPMPHEENPFLGERGLRMCFDRPELMRGQFRAVLRASQRGNVRVMFPMIVRTEEIRMAKQVMEEERQQLGLPPISIGIMIEVPGAAVIADQLIQEVDFFSIGTNDLTQYTLAMDRGHPKLAPFIDALNPSVLTLIGMTARAANNAGKWAGVCGGVASDPQAVPLLIGLGIKELSCSIPAIPSVKAQIRELNLAECQQLAEKALKQPTAEAVRNLVPLEDE
jgi:phosphocarrier protein FPr